MLVGLDEDLGGRCVHGYALGVTSNGVLGRLQVGHWAICGEDLSRKGSSARVSQSASQSVSQPGQQAERCETAQRRRDGTGWDGMGCDGCWDDTTPSWALSLHLMAASEITPNDMVKLPRSLNVTCEKWTERGVGWVGGESW